MRQNGQIAQLVEQGIENPRVGGSIPSLATIFSFSAVLLLGCSPDPCTELCEDTTEALQQCLGEWSLDWEDFDASSQSDFQERCSNRWGEVRSNLVARELGDARDQCRETQLAIEASVETEESCDLLRAIYVD